MQVGEYKSPLSSMRDHRSLVAWQVARALVSQVMAISRAHYHPRVSIIFSQNAKRVSVNTTEYRRRIRPSIQSLVPTPSYDCLCSAVETAELLDLCVSEGIVPEAVVEPARKQCSRTQALLMGLRKQYAPKD